MSIQISPTYFGESQTSIILKTWKSCFVLIFFFLFNFSFTVWRKWDTGRAHGFPGLQSWEWWPLGMVPLSWLLLLWCLQRRSFFLVLLTCQSYIFFDLSKSLFQSHISLGFRCHSVKVLQKKMACEQFFCSVVTENRPSIVGRGLLGRVWLTHKSFISPDHALLFDWGSTCG